MGNTYENSCRMAIPIKKCFHPSLSFFYKDKKGECPLTKVEQFFKCSLWIIYSRYLTTSPYIWNQWVGTNFKRERY